MAEKYIMVMADYMTDGLWHKNGTPLCDDEIKKLELDIFLLKRLNKWCDWYETNDDWSVNSKHDFEYEKFADEGLQIAKQIKKSLAKKGFDVWYCDEYALVHDRSRPFKIQIS